MSCGTPRNAIMQVLCGYKAMLDGSLPLSLLHEGDVLLVAFLRRRQEDAPRHKFRNWRLY